jgi:predicted transcriptional regulator
VESPPRETELSREIEDLLEEFKERVNEYIAKVKAFCEEHAKTVSEKGGKYEYWLNTCLWRHRRITHDTLKIYAEKNILRYASRENMLELEKRIRDIVESALDNIYPSQYPPIY